MSDWCILKDQTRVRTAGCVYVGVCINPDTLNCTPDTPGTCHPDATCAPVSPYVCSATRVDVEGMF